jgi:tetratricopeptide (TPR) repeat protein
MNTEKEVEKVVAEAFLRMGKLNALREKYMLGSFMPDEDPWEVRNSYIRELRGVIELLVEAIRLDVKKNYPYLHTIICSIILDGMFGREELEPYLTFDFDEDKDIWMVLDLHLDEAIKGFVELLKRIVGLRIGDKPNFWKELSIYDEKWMSSFDIFNSCKRLSPNDPSIRYLIGEFYRRFGEYRKRRGYGDYFEYFNSAERYFKDAVELDPTYGMAWKRLAEVQLERGNYDKAVEYYMKYLELIKDSWSEWKQIAEVYEKKGDLEKAIECTRKVVELHPCTRHHLHLARLLAKQDRREEALKAVYEVGGNLKQMKPLELIELYGVYHELDEYEKCADVLEELINSSKRDLLMGEHAEIVEKCLNEYRRMATETLIKIITKASPDRRKKLVELILEKIERM